MCEINPSNTNLEIAIIFKSWTPPVPYSTKPSSCIKVLIGSKFQGMKAMKPFVFSWSFTILKKWSTISCLFSTWPYIIVAEAGRPSECASSIILIQSALEIFLGLMISLTESTKISAPAPGMDCKPASFSLDKISFVDDFSTFAIISISDVDNPWTPTCGNFSLIILNASS